ncbi:helix-turn-helix transcriptional regulator [Streptomyces drozdowiczii]|uniref:Helix-turn-helix transcriptional regulator n=1 Tax=Streptomyces drozdowiczii TaxID=202862 RepID=A0ABY6PYI9_9ACTN|nr:helix-turn-helix transcriptional regulator [Streptomyces drozdowiczii]MCX0242747.1 helix-turn-helix transcriptional regulator [Streptomyces drozdowiczii]UZK57238.1 helix-turn-helix transcriptional regulator [Streptomyces drozdowiczii]
MSPRPEVPPSPSAVPPPGPPAAARSSLIRLQEDLRRADDSLVRLLAAWRPDGREVPGQFVEFWEGREAQARRLYELEYGARTSLLGFQSGANTVAPVPSTLADPADGAPEEAEGEEGARDAEAEPPLRKDGNPHAAYRVVVDRAFLTEPEALRALDERLAAGHQVRVVDQPLIKLLIADEETAMVQLEAGRSMILGPPLVRLAVELFESVWQRSRPYLREDGDLDPADRRLLQLMLSGLTDAATAHQLGTSPRTVQRRLRALMDAASVSSRVQLGWYAMRNNWV